MFIIFYRIKKKNLKSTLAACADELYARQTLDEAIPRMINWLKVANELSNNGFTVHVAIEMSSECPKNILQYTFGRYIDIIWRTFMTNSGDPLDIICCCANIHRGFWSSDSDIPGRSMGYLWFSGTPSLFHSTHTHTQHIENNITRNWYAVWAGVSVRNYCWLKHPHNLYFFLWSR